MTPLQLPFSVCSTDLPDRPQPVSRGALLRYYDITIRGLPANDAFGIGLDEVYRPDLHPDATFFPGARLPSGLICEEIQPNEQYVGEDPDNTDVLQVYGRWYPIMEKVRIAMFLRNVSISNAI